MKKHSFLETALKLLSLFFLVKTVESLRDLITLFPTSTYTEFTSEPESYYILSAWALGTDLLFFWAFAYKTKQILSFLKIPEPAHDTLPLGIKKHDLVETGLILVGVVATIYSLPEVLILATNKLFEFEQQIWFPIHREGNIVYSILKLAAGIAVILFSGTLCKILLLEIVTNTSDKAQNLPEQIKSEVK